MLENLLEKSRLFPMVRGGLAVRERGGMEPTAGESGEVGRQNPDGREGGGKLEVGAVGARGRVELEVGVEVDSEPGGDEGGERGVGRGHVVGKTGFGRR